MAELNIDGRTSLYALTGKHTGFSPIPALFNTISSFIGYNSVMMPFDTDKSEIHTILDALRLLKCKGAFIDTPHRCELDDLLITMSDEARCCGAVNIIRIDERGYHGHNTEMDAFRKAFPLITEQEIFGKKIFLIGGGGIARAIAAACAADQCDRLTIAGRTAEKVQQISDLVNSCFGDVARVADFDDPDTIHSFYNADIIIHATSAGMFPQLDTNPLPADYHFMTHHLILDTVYNPPQTKLLRIAEEKGCRVFNGRDIMFFSCLEAFQWWTGVHIDEESENKLFHMWKDLIYNV